MLPGYGFSSGSGVLLIFLLPLLLFWIFVILIYSFGDVLLKFDHANDHSGNLQRQRALDMATLQSSQIGPYPTPVMKL